MALYARGKSLSPKLVWQKSKKKLKFKETCLKQDKANSTPKNVINLFMVYELDTWSQDLYTDFTFKNYLFESVKLTKNGDPSRYYYSGNGIGFDSCSLF